MGSAWGLLQDTTSNIAPRDITNVSAWGIMDEQDDDTLRKRIINRTRNIGRIIGAGVDLMTGQPADPNVIKPLIEGYRQTTPVSEQVKTDFKNVFSKADFRETISNLYDGTIDRIKNKKMETLGAIAKMPYSILDSMIGDTFNAISGVDISGKEIKPLDFGEHTRSTKGLIGNAVAALVAPAVSKMITAATELPAAAALGERGAVKEAGASLIGKGTQLTEEEIKNASLGGLARLSELEPRFGNLGRALISDVGAGAASGMAQGAISNANDPNVLAAMATGLLFAPIGALTAWYRGAKNPVGKVEAAITEANDVRMLRQWQEINDANIDGARLKVEALLTSDDIAQALGKERFRLTDPNDVHTAEPIDHSHLRIDDLYDDFIKSYDKHDSFESQLVKYAFDKGLDNNLNELLEKFTDRFEQYAAPDEIAHLRNLIEENKEHFSGDFSKYQNDVVSAATHAGVYLTNEHGLMKIRDIETGDVLGEAVSTKDALDQMKAMGKPANPTNPASGAPMPTVNMFGNAVGLGPAVSPHLLDDFEPQYTNPTARTAALDIGIGRVTAMSPYIEAVDRTNFGSADLPRRTNFKHTVFEPLEKAHRLTMEGINKAMESPEVRRIESFIRRPLDKYGRGGRFNKEQLEQVALLREAQSVDEIMSPGGYSKNFTVSPDALSAAKFAHDNGVDLHKVLTYRRVRSAVDAEFATRAHNAALEEMQMNKKTGMSTADAAAIYDTKANSWQNSPEYAAIQQEIQKKFNPDQNFLTTVQRVDNLFRQPDGAANSAAMVRLKLALDNPDTHGVTRTEFAKKHNLSADQVKLGDMLDDAYNEFGKKFGIPDSRMLMRYMNHYRQFADIMDTDILGDFENGIMDGAMKQFASAMIRTGEVANYSSDPIQSLYSYIRGGVKGQHLYPVMNDVFSATDGAFRKEVAKITDPVIKNAVTKRFDDYSRDISGQRSIGDTEAMHARVHMLRNLMLDENGKKMSPNEIVAEMNRPDRLDTMMNLSSAGLLGGRVSLAIRDNWDLWQKYYVKHGIKDFSKLMRQKVSKANIQELVEQGEISNPEGVDVYNISHSQGPSGGIHGFAKDLANIGFKTSLQGHYYMKNQAAVYIHTVKRANAILNKIGDSYSKAKAYEDLELRLYEPSTQKIFDAYVRDGLFEDASKLLARDEVREMVGNFTRGNQAPVLNTKIGKLFGQLGSWGMTNRSVLQNLLTRGTHKDIARAHARYAATIAGTVLAGAATGLNLGRWLLLPTSLIATGGPILSSVQSIGSEMASELGGSEAQTRFTRRAAQRSLQQFLPFSYATQDILKAAQLATEGSGYGLRVGAQALGIPVNKEDRTFLDWFMGNYPISP